MLDEPSQHHIRWKKPANEDHIGMLPLKWNVPELANLYRQKVDKWLLRPGVQGVGREMAQGLRGNVEGFLIYMETLFSIYLYKKDNKGYHE